MLNQVFAEAFSSLPDLELKYIPGMDNLGSSSVQPEPGFDIGNRNQGPISVLVMEPKLFSKTETRI
jgi:hypothetical protein